MQSLKVLIAEDCASDAELALYELRHAGYVVEATRVDTEADFRRCLTPSVDVILADYVMPQFDALRALAILKESRLGIPFIIVSGSIGEDLAIAAMRDGADDYLLKDRLSRLGQAVAHALRVKALRDGKHHSDEQLRLQVAALQAAANAIVITTSKGEILWVNPAFEALTEYSFLEIAGKNPRILKSDHQDEQFYKRMWGTILSGKVWQGEVVNRRKSGTLYHEEMTVTPVQNDAGVITHFIAIKQDVTDRKRVQEKLFQAQKLDSIGTLAGGIAHDFNNLLVAILGFTEMALLDLDSPNTARADMLEVKKAADRASGLTRQLMAFSRKQLIEPRTLDLNALIANMEEMLRRLLGEDVHLALDLMPGLGSVKADAGQLEQIIMNLTVNARDAMPSGGRLILATGEEDVAEAEAATQAGAHSGRFITVAVTDTGVGMSKEVQSRLFEPFFTTKDPGKGTGLGLAVVYGITKQHDGWIRVSSQPGQGTTFKVYFPECTVPTDPIGGDKAADPAQWRGQSERILIVEDDEAVRRFAERLLSSNGYRVAVAADGREALDIMAGGNASVDVLFCDAILPNVNGYELADELSRAHPDLKIIITSGHEESKARTAHARAAGWQILPKPYTAESLLKALHKILHNGAG